MKRSVIEKIKQVKLLALDVDGVLTTGKIILDHKGKEIKIFDVQDGFGIVFFRKMGFKTAIISARSAEALSSRAADLKIDRVFQDAFPKIKAYEKLLEEFNLIDQEVCFIGDDLPDLAILKKVGFPVAVANASKEVKQAASYITKRNGGEGAVREAIELILKVKGLWKKVLKTLE